MDKKRSIGVTIFSFLGFIVAMFMIGIFSNPPAIFAYFIAAVIILLSVGLFLLWNWVRITFIILSWLFICLYVWGIACIFIFPGPQGGLELGITLPILLFGIISFIFFNRPKVKEQFK